MNKQITMKLTKLSLFQIVFVFTCLIFMQAKEPLKFLTDDNVKEFVDYDAYILSIQWGSKNLNNL